jgi:tripartite ATP-independent transporter DctP family solute receptor
MKRGLVLQSVVVVVAVVAMVAGFGLASAQDIRERTIKFATQNPKGHPIPTGMEKFAELVEARTKGKIKVNLFPGGVLGSDAANVSAIQGGTLEMASMNAGILASQVKEFGIWDFPFMFGGGAEADTVCDGPFGQMMFDKLEPKGIVGLAYFELGFRHITNSKRALNRVEDIAGLKLRVIPNPINVDWVSALGASPTPLAWPEVYAALEQKAVDGQENPFTVILANKIYEVQKFLAITNHQYNPQAVMISKKFWDTLTADEKKIIKDSAREAAVFQRKFNREQMGAALDGLKKHGMQVTEFSAAEMAKFREKMKPVIEKHGAIVGPEVVSALQAELAKLRR